MASKQATLSKNYLSILGGVSLILGALIVIGSIIFMVVDFDLSKLEYGFFNDALNRVNGDVHAAKIITGVSMMIMGFFQMFIGWLERRASVEPEKSLLLLVLVVLGIVAGLYTMFNGGFTDIGNALGNVISLTINVLAFMALYNIRKMVVYSKAM